MSDSTHSGRPQTVTPVKRFWGTTYHGTGDLQVAAEAIVAACEAAGMTCYRQHLETDLTRIEAVQRAAWHRILLEGLPQRSIWQLAKYSDKLEVYLEHHWFRWFRTVFAAFMFLFVLCFVIAAALSRRSPGFDWLDIVETWLLLTVILLIPVIFHLLQGAAHYTEDVRQTFLARVRRAGGFLEPHGSGVSRRTITNLGTLLCFVVVLATWLIWDTLQHYENRLPAGLIVLLTTYLTLAFFLVATALLMLRRAEFNFRVAPLHTGVITSLAVLLFLSPATLWLGIGANIDLSLLKAGESFLQENAFPEEWDGARTDEILERMRRHYLPLRSLARQFLFVIAFVVVLGATIFIRFAVSHSITTGRILRTYQRNRGHGVYRRATRGGPFLNGFRTMFVVSWLLFTVSILANFGFLTLYASQPLAPIFPHHDLHLVKLSAATVSFALGRPIGGGMIDMAVGAGWILHALSGLALFAVSTGQLFLEERAQRRRLRQAVRSPSDPRQNALQKTVDHLAAKVRLGRVHLVVSSELPPEVSSRVFGFWRQQRFVEISALCVERLRREETAALLAHEIAHHRRGHCRRFQLLRWLGRLSFVGDGFVLTLQNSWAWEDGADRTAVEELGVPQEMLLQALRKLRSISSIWKLEGRGNRRGLHAQPEDSQDLAALLAEGPFALPPRERWRRAWKLFRQQYFHAMELHYWYPPNQERDHALGAA